MLILRHETTRSRSWSVPPTQTCLRWRPGRIGISKTRKATMMSVSATRLSILAIGLVAATAITLSACNSSVERAPTVGGADATVTTEGSMKTPAIGAPQGRPAMPSFEGTPGPPLADCPRLESVLYQLATADDPAAFAVSHNLYYDGGTVRVVVELQRPDDNFPAGYGATEEARSGDRVQALVPIDQLCRLSNAPQVRFVRAPIEPKR